MTMMTTRKRFEDVVVVVLLLSLLFLDVVVLAYDDDDGAKVKYMPFGCCYKIIPFILSKISSLISLISLNMKTSKSEIFNVLSYMIRI